MLLLYAVWPFFWLVHLVLATPRAERPRRAIVALAHGVLVVALSILTIDAGYLFEGVGKPLGRFEFASLTLTRPVADGIRKAPATRNPLYAMLWPFRENRFRGTLLENVPRPCPSTICLASMSRKSRPTARPTGTNAPEGPGRGRRGKGGSEAGSANQSVAGYPVYLDGQIRRSGWWDYYLRTLLYKVPEGTWLLVLFSIALLAVVRRSGAAWADELCLATVPVVVLFSMSFLTNINLGLRYVLSIAPYVFISRGKWFHGLRGLPHANGRSVDSSRWALWDSPSPPRF